MGFKNMMFPPFNRCTVTKLSFEPIAHQNYKKLQIQKDELNASRRDIHNSDLTNESLTISEDKLFISTNKSIFTDDFHKISKSTINDHFPVNANNSSLDFYVNDALITMDNEDLTTNTDCCSSKSSVEFRIFLSGNDSCRVARRGGRDAPLPLLSTLIRNFVS